MILVRAGLTRTAPRADLAPPTMPLRNLSLRRKLPLLVSGLTAGALVLAGALAYLEIRGAAIAAAEARLESIVSELGTLTMATQTARTALEQRVTTAPEVRAALRREAFDTVALEALLGSLRTPNDAGMPVSVVRRDGTAAFGTGSFDAAADPDPTPPLREERAIGPFRSVADRIVYWVSLPLTGPGDQPEGWIVQRRSVGDVRATGDVLEALTGGGIRLLVGSANDSVWIDLSGGGAVQMPIEDVVMGEPYHFRDPNAGDMLAVAGPLPEAARVVQADMPMAEVLARPRSFLENALVLGAALTALAILIAWVSSGRLTGPLQDLAEAADAMAAGNYRKRVEPVATDEIGRLARAFNAMGDQVARADEALRGKLQELQALAKRLEEANVAAERARAEAQDASRVKSEFLAVMSHEIRTPINVVVSYVELLKAGVPDQPTERQRHYLQRIDQSSQLLVWLLNDLLDYSRIESGQMHVEMGTGSALLAIRNAMAALEPLGAGKGIELSCPCSDDVRFHADAQRVQQIVLNLLSNAIKFTPRGGSVALTCAESASGPDGTNAAGRSWVRIDVVDTGVGIPADQIPRMFEPFVRGDAEGTGETTGAGLGLAISQRLAGMMSGAITVDSVVNGGTRFTLWLVAADQLVGAMQRATKTAAATQSVPTPRSRATTPE